MRDLTRIATAGLLDEVGADLERMVAGLRSIATTDEAKRRCGAESVESMLRAGQQGSRRFSGKHGVRPEQFEAGTVVVGDQPGELARLFRDADQAGVTIEVLRAGAQGAAAGARCRYLADGRRTTAAGCGCMRYRAKARADRVLVLAEEAGLLPCGRVERAVREALSLNMCMAAGSFRTTLG
ncbi:hypothetical protein [Streptomyces sp. NPDC058683]|uniref:hypothetical protein n=1 Tax=Streptomyces sp. NPDC058683 TaxID=3346597 RepID=UPI00365CC9C0